MFSYDDLGALMQILGYAPDSKTLADMLKAARVKAARGAATNVCTIPSNKDAAALLIAEHQAAMFQTQSGPGFLRGRSV